MEKRNEKRNWSLEQLLHTRAFSELSPDQQTWVLQQTSLEEYDQQRWVLLASKDYLATDLVPAPPSLESILQSSRSKPSRSSFFSYIENITSWRVPAWQLGMAIICGWIFGQWNAGEKNSGLNLVPQIVYQSDTIVKEIPVYISLGKQRYAAYLDSQNIEAVSPSQTPRRENDPTVITSSTNASIARDRELMELAVGMK